MQKFVRKYVCYYATCKRSKRFRFKKQGVFWFLFILDQRWLDISFNFVSIIPSVKKANAICNIVDRLSKKRYHIATNNKTDAKRLVDLFVHHVWKLHSFPTSIISDHSSQFISNFWKFLIKKLDINVKLSIACYLKTNGQTQLINGVIEQYLRVYINYSQDDWPD